MATVKIGADTTPAGAPKAYFVKLFAKGEVERSFAHAAALYGYWRGRDCGLLFPEPVAALPQHNALAYRCMAGVPLVEAIAADRDVSVVAERVADALIALHTSTPSRSLPPGGDRTLRKLRRTVAIGSWSLPVHADRIRRIADRTAEALRVSVSAPTHHDMKPEHVFVGKGSVGLIDVESLCLDVPTIDLGCLLARLDLTTSADPFIRIALRAAARAIESRYCSRAPARWLSTLSAAKAYGALLLVAHHVQGQGSDWAGQATRALDWAEFAVAPIGQRGLDGLGNAGATGGTGRATTVQS